MAQRKVVEWVEQGDVCLIPISDAEFRRLTGQLHRIVNGGVVALGEATGHRHRVVGAAELWGDDRVRCFRVGADTEIVHEEHRAASLRRSMHTWHEGAYRVAIVQEFDHFAEEARAVQD